MAHLAVLTAAIELALEEDELEQKWHIFIKRTEATEEKFKPKLRTAFTKQEKAVLAKARRTPVPNIARGWRDDNQYGGRIDQIVCRGARISLLEVSGTLKASEEAEAAAEKFVDQIYTASAWQKPFETVWLPFVTLAYKEAGDAALAEIGLDAAFDVTNPRARKFLQDRVFDNVKGVNDVTREKLRRALVQGFDADESIPEISKRIAGVFDIAKGSRTEMIARTEIVGASNNGTFHAYTDSEIVDTKVWIDSRDDRVRTSPHNHKIDGQERKLKAKFSNGLLHPHDPNGAAGNVINCRCTLTAEKLKEAA